MSRVFEERAYQADSLRGCFWAEDYPRHDLQWDRAEGVVTADVAIVGAGFTGLSAALHLAQSGVDVAVFDMHAPGWGASGRNGGFCCRGGSKLGDDAIRRRFGEEGLEEWDKAEGNAVHLVDDLISRYGIDTDTHSDGETQLAHSLRSYRRLRNRAEREGLTFIASEDLAAAGMNASGLYGGITEPVGFGLHPRKYVLGLAEAARMAGARIYSDAPVRGIEGHKDGYMLDLPDAKVRCRKLVMATNGYSSDDVPGWLRARYMPTQSNILVTRELTEAELEAQGWTSNQMVYDTRKLLHYFRLMPNRRMMFGMRGGIMATERADRKMHRMIRRDFETMFPAWAHVETPWFWTGLVCLTSKRVPFVGEVPEMKGVFAGFGWHGNGVAMGTYAGHLLAQLVQGQDESVPMVMRGAPTRIPFGSARRGLLPPIYAGLGLLDRIR